LRAVLRRIPTGQVGDDQQAAAPSPAAARRLGGGTYECLDHGCQAVLAPGDRQQVALAECQELGMPVDDGAEDAVA
jgi:hypothetical protein